MKIIKAKIGHASILEKVGREAFLTGHGKSQPIENLEYYLANNYTAAAFEKDISLSNNRYNIIYLNNVVVGFSNITLNASHEYISDKTVTKLDRIYLLKEVHGQNLGVKLLDFNVKLSKENGQKGMWLAVWTGNERAYNFYKKVGFKVIGNHNFKITEENSNPNYIMYLEY